MQISYTADVLNTLTRLVNFIESKNTRGAGLRWLKKFEIFVEHKLQNPDKIHLCNNQTFYNLKLRCIVYHEWLIAFSIHKDYLLIEAFLHKSRVAD